MTMTNAERVAEIWRLCAELSESTGRPFTPDGHLVGSLGEVAAADALGLTLNPPSVKGYDAVTADGQKLEVKTTDGNRSVSVTGDAPIADLLCVVTVDRSDGTPTIVYFGPAAPAWNLAGRAGPSGQRLLSLADVRRLAEEM
ncbi:MAG: hypothetical protein AAGG01_03030 [Planctomycetota bacterium]